MRHESKKDIFPYFETKNVDLLVTYSQKVNWIFDVLLLRDGLSTFVWRWWILFKHEYNKISCCKYIIHNANCDLTIDQKLIWKQFQILQIHSALCNNNAYNIVWNKIKDIFQFSFVVVQYIRDGRICKTLPFEAMILHSTFLFNSWQP